MDSYLSKCTAHFQRLFAAAKAETNGNWWPSVVDVRTGQRPDGEHVPKRVYRLIGAPRGSTPYWDQPSIVAAHILSEQTGDPQYKASADRYIRTFLDTCIADNGLFQWGNHQYFDVFEKTVISFCNGYHELRPITPAWDIFWRIAPKETEQYIRTMLDLHIYDKATGGFNRHDDRKKEHAFLEAGGILCESAAWLYAKTNDQSLADTALRVAQYSYEHRNKHTGLVPNEPDLGRWDAKVSTSEVGLWAQCLLRAKQYLNNDVLLDMAKCAVRAYANHAFDPQTKRYFGQVSIDDGSPVIPDKQSYWPGEFADAWNANQWPTHDYPMALGEACLALYQLTNESVFKQHATNLAEAMLANRPAVTDRWSYAENYGRAIHVLAHAGYQLGDEKHLQNAHDLAAEAIDALWEESMFMGYPNDHLYESVDGVGFLMLALIYLELQQPLDLQGFGF